MYIPTYSPLISVTFAKWKYLDFASNVKVKVKVGVAKGDFVPKVKVKKKMRCSNYGIPTQIQKMQGNCLQYQSFKDPISKGSQVFQKGS